MYIKSTDLINYKTIYIITDVQQQHVLSKRCACDYIYIFNKKLLNNKPHNIIIYHNNLYCKNKIANTSES